MKNISINDVRIKEITLAENEGKVSVGVWYSLIDDTGAEIQTKRDIIPFDQLQKAEVDKILKMLSIAKDAMKAKEQI